MRDASTTRTTDFDEDHDLGGALSAWNNAGPSEARAPRKQREMRLTGNADGRALRATGRNEQFNFKARAGTKVQAQRAAASAGMTIAEFMEKAVELMARQIESEKMQEAGRAG